MKKLMLVMLLALSVTACATKNAENVLTISEKNTVALRLPIMSDTASRVGDELLQKSRKLSKNEPIYLVLDTPGGSIEDGLKLVEVAKSLPRPVHTISIFNASMGFVISQYLDDRYVLDSSVMMSHRAFIGGMRGEYPGSLISRFLALGNQLMNINSKVAERAEMPLKTYLDITANELWMGSDQAIELKFADKKIILQCDESLSGYGEPESVNLGFFSVKVQFHKCPLISQPKVISGDSKIINEFVNDKIEFLRKYNFFLK